jgi:hypothetical protein
LFLLPILFLPNLGLGSYTSYGSFDFSDYIIVFYLLSLWPAARRTTPYCAERLGYLVSVFLVWAFLGAATVNFRYDYGADTHALSSGLLKLAKLVLYGWAGWLTTRALKDGEVRRQFHWSLLAILAVLGVSLLAGPGKNAAAELASWGYKSNNPISVGLAILVSYVGGLLLCRHGSRGWRWAAAIAVALGLAGTFVSGGRGGWLAVIGAAAYFFSRRGFRVKAIGLCVVILLVGYLSYQLFPDFGARLRFTVGEDFTSSSPTRDAVRLGGIDVGGRPIAWFGEGPKLLDAPMLGAGFFHRGGLSPLETWGSHNFFLQMFLETGIVGGGLMLLALRRMWTDSASPVARRRLLKTPLRAALIAASVGGMGGEYYYGGVVLLALFLVYAPAGGLPPGGTSFARKNLRRRLHD